MNKSDKQAACTRIADAFRKIASAAMEINEVLGKYEELNDAVPADWPLNLSADEFAHECFGMADHYDAEADYHTEPRK